jgi:hypothetical protein
MNDETRQRLRSALNTLTPPPSRLTIPELPERSHRDHRREAAAVAAACLLAVALAGSLIWLRTQGSVRPLGVPAATGTPATNATPAPPSAAPTTPGPVAVAPTPSPTQAGTPRCHTGDLGARFQLLNPAAGNRYAALILTNNSAHQCTVYGFPGMLQLDGNSRPMPTNVVRDGSVPQTVTLDPGGSAWSRLHWGAVPGAGESQTGPCEPQAPWIEITPPDETTQLVISWNVGPVCEQGRIDVSPFATGTGPGY